MVKRFKQTTIIAILLTVLALAIFSALVSPFATFINYGINNAVFCPASTNWNGTDCVYTNATGVAGTRSVLTSTALSLLLPAIALGILFGFLYYALPRRGG